jgi:hypothetical protein
MIHSLVRASSRTIVFVQFNRMGLKTVWVKSELFGSEIIIMTLVFALVYSYLYHTISYIFMY